MPCTQCDGSGVVGGARGGGNVHATTICSGCGGSGQVETGTLDGRYGESAGLSPHSLAPRDPGPVPWGDPRDPTYRKQVLRWFRFAHTDLTYELLCELERREPHRFERAVRSIRDGRHGDVAQHLYAWKAGRA